MAADEKKMLSTFNRLTLVARHLSRSPAALIGTRRCESSLSNRNLLINHPRKMYRIEERGAPNTLEHRIFFRDEFGPVSPFHDIPLFANQEQKVFNMVVEVPRWTNAKMEICKEEPLNPIKQDVKKGKLRFVANCFPHHGYIWNYGALPQTWENPNVVDERTGCKGDNDPIDVCEIGHRVAKRGDVLQVKVLGTIALIDEGETDWKVIAIDVNDPLAAELNNIEDVEKHMPGFMNATVEWFRIYKMPDGKPANEFAFNGAPKPHEFALEVIVEAHEHWKKMVAGQVDCHGVNSTCVSADGAPCKVPISEAQEIVKKSPELTDGPGLESEVDKWHYTHLQK
ncbi:Inorganic pyrophosphatase/nucleosome remodeling factor subunit NURF38 [Daphnia magna]|uniref:Inorganic pyrophosphatase n=1 Tax=Daphnia magna TaxID=35525 RepID=A0A162QQ82_9CRUS|nr:Inorganic pyrophosphatase/nucleosome remodeling factor subunit NURF38 [Daphnia magna]